MWNTRVSKLGTGYSSICENTCDTRFVTGGPFALGLHEIMAIGIYACQPLVAAIAVLIQDPDTTSLQSRSKPGTTWNILAHPGTSWHPKKRFETRLNLITSHWSNLSRWVSELCTSVNHSSADMSPRLRVRDDRVTAQCNASPLGSPRGFQPSKSSADCWF